MDDAMESPAAEYPESPMDAYTCKGCGDVLDEGKAFELGEFITENLTAASPTTPRRSSWRLTGRTLCEEQQTANSA
jgi:hypothetical protein